MRLNTLGRAYIARDRDGGEEIALQPLAVALLAYLSVGGPRDRDHLADMFWRHSKNGLNTLSTTLNRIRAEAPDSVWVQGNTLVGTNLACDVDDLRDAIDRSDYEAVRQLYSAPFLGSLRLRRKSLEFEEWMLDQRATLAATVELALLQRGRELYDAGEHRTAATSVEKAWEIAIRDGFPSQDHFEVYHRILASAANPSANAVRSMAEDLGIELAPVEPVAFEPDATHVEASASVPSASVPHTPGPSSFDGEDRVASEATPFFGCQEELDAIAASVTSDRLTTIIGLGGSGKTRLATEFFNSPDAERDFPHRYWVNLRDVAEPDLVAPAIATTLGHRFDNVASLAKHLPEDQPVLLVLDNFEHVLCSAAIAEELVQHNEAVRILATSRVPLEVSSESVVKLRGLEIADLEVDSPAEQLFVSSARRAGVGDDRLTGSNRTAIRDVCRRVGGNPLALEIAGGWAQVLSPTEILDVLSVDNELLGAPMGSSLRSMDAVLQQSWSTLAETEQNTLMLLATFPGGCLTSEALKLQRLPIRSLGRLVQHSLAQLEVHGRITLHPLIAGHALHEIDQRPELRRTFQQILSNWCLSYTASSLSDSTSKDAHTLDAEIANFTAAWLWDAQQGVWGLHRATLAPLRQFFNESGRVREGRALFETVAELMRADPNTPRDLLSAVLEALGWFQFLSGEVSQARTLLAEALELSPADDPHAQARILRSLGALQLSAGEIDEATADLQSGLALIADEPCALTASLQYDLAQALHYRGDRDQAASAARLALQVGRAVDDWLVMTTSYLLLADIEVESDPERAIVLLNEGWAIAKEASLDNLAIYFPHILGLAHLKLHEMELAESSFSDGIEAANKVGQLTTVCANYVGRAESRLLSDRTADAIEDLKTAIRLALKTDSGRYLMWAAVVSCRVQPPCLAPNTHAKELLLLTLRHPATDQDAQDKAAEALRDLFGMTPDADTAMVSDAIEAGLDEVAERSLQLLTLR